MAREITRRIDLCEASQYAETISLMAAEAIRLHEQRSETAPPEAMNVSVFITDDIEKAIAAIEDIVFFIGSDPQKIDSSRITALQAGSVGEALLKALAARAC